MTDSQAMQVDKPECSDFKVPSLLLRPKTQSKAQEVAPEDLEGALEEDSSEAPPVPYNEPSWSTTPPDSYTLTVIKSGTIIQTVQLSGKPFHVFGRLPSCDVQFEHPSVSRHHAILQYRPLDRDAEGDPVIDPNPGPLVSVNPKEEGFYVYDLGSTHGTFINKTKIQMRCFYRLRLGQMVKFGGSSRLFLLEVL